MQCARMLCAAHRCFLHLQNICSAVTSCTAPGKTLHFISKDVSPFKDVKSLAPLKFTRCLCSCSSVRKCWSCGSSAQLFFCSSCKTIQPPHNKATYFEILNCDQTFALDAQKLQGKYIELQRSLHPDNFSQKSQREWTDSRSLRHYPDTETPEEDEEKSNYQRGGRLVIRESSCVLWDCSETVRELGMTSCEQNTEQRYSEEQSALVNKAYRTLQKPLTRSVYLLRLRGVKLEEGTDSAADPALLLKVMEVNEKLAETQSLDEVNSVGQEVQATLKTLTEQMNASLNKGDLQSAREILAQMKYFANLDEKVKEKLREIL